MSSDKTHSAPESSTAMNNTSPDHMTMPDHMALSDHKALSDHMTTYNHLKMHDHMPISDYMTLHDHVTMSLLHCTHPITAPASVVQCGEVCVMQLMVAKESFLNIGHDTDYTARERNLLPRERG